MSEFPCHRCAKPVGSGSTVLRCPHCGHWTYSRAAVGRTVLFWLVVIALPLVLAALRRRY